MKDNIFAQPLQTAEDFKFDDKVADVFPDMIKRSIPGYENVIIMSGLFAERFAQPDSNCYDLGCSLGATTLSMRARISQPGCRIIAVDNSESMVSRCRKIIDSNDSQVPVSVIQADIRNVDYQKNSLTVINFTLQFLPVEDRLPLLRKIYDSMLPGAALILSEKITFEDRENSELFIDIYHAWKAHNGYSEMEIRQKRNALENVMKPDTVRVHRERLAAAGFKRCEIWFQCFNFISLAAFK